MKISETEVINGVSDQIQWWMGERYKKLAELRHETMSVNPFLLPLIFGIHDFKDFEELAEFLVASHLSGGYNTGFGKLIDEKILPKVFKTTKLDKEQRKNKPFSLSVFDEVDHIIYTSEKDLPIILSLKAGRWTIQLTMAVQLNEAFNKILSLRETGSLNGFDFDRIAVGVFYGKKETLTDKYDIIRGINRGADHSVHDIREHVDVYAGEEFWSLLNEGERQTQNWVLSGIQNGFNISQKKYGSLSSHLDSFRKEFSKQFAQFVDSESRIDWRAILKDING